MRSEAFLHPVHKDLCSEKNETMVYSFESLIQTKIVLILRYNRNCYVEVCDGLWGF